MFSFFFFSFNSALDVDPNVCTCVVHILYICERVCVCGCVCLVKAVYLAVQKDKRACAWLSMELWNPHMLLASAVHGEREEMERKQNACKHRPYGEQLMENRLSNV